MSRIIIISNRLPVTVKKNGKRLEYIDSIGGLSTGLKKYHEEADSVWVGWPGIADEELTSREKRSIEKKLKEKYNCLPVFLTQEEVNKYYFGFCNNTIWPLFHYFSSQTEYNIATWEAYSEVNQKFYDRMKSSIGKKDTVWVHDYQLMLLPEIIKRHNPNVQVGFFLHIPFPSAELFRLLVWREEILLGLLGADLIGFHTYDYVRHFLSCTRRLLGLDDVLNVINYEDRYVKVDSFPMGIDYKRFNEAYDEANLSPEVLEVKKIKETKKIILSIDRLDYSKGIPARIRAYNNFLAKYPQYKGKVRLNLIVAPSRTEIENYELLLKEIREMVSETNGTFGTMNWMPIWFLFKTFSQEELIALYRNSDVLLVTPLRDGMNLIAKEYVAARTDFDGMLVLSETAGAASELAEAVIVNANDSDSVAKGIKTALEMTLEEKIARNKIMHQRLKRYTVEVWAEDFLKQLKSTCEDAEVVALPKPIETSRDQIDKAYRNAKKRILFLDYDGTLVGFKAIPEQAIPDSELKGLLRSLISDTKNTVVLISGRDRKILDAWFADVKGLSLVASHGLWLKHSGQKWVMTASLDNEWKESVRPIFELYADRMPGAIVEEKEFALSLHYRRCNPDMVVAKLNELKQTLVSMTKSSSLVVQEGSKVLELKDSKVNKGIATTMMLDHNGYDFIFGSGDDLTDEDTFRALPLNAISVKVGLGRTAARYRTKSWLTMRKVLKRFAEIEEVE
jgi:trehalose 6-phosphate synthase/phosphatase